MGKAAEKLALSAEKENVVLLFYEPLDYIQ